MWITCPYCKKRFEAKGYEKKEALTAAKGLGRYLGKTTVTLGGLALGTAISMANRGSHLAVECFEGSKKVASGIFGKDKDIKVVEKIKCPHCQKKFNPLDEAVKKGVKRWSQKN